jgi:DNA-binding GntR family transcriptional regulator
MTRLRPPALESSLSAIAYQTVREQIHTCALRPGQTITEREIAVKLGIGLSPARDALLGLTRDGLIRRTPHRGYQVAPLTLKSVDDLFLTWSLIGPEIVRLGIRNASNEQTDRISRLGAQIEAAFELPSEPARNAQSISAGHALFELLCEVGHNDRLLEAYRGLADDLTRVLSLLLADRDAPERLRAVCLGADALFRRRDEERVVRWVQNFIESAYVQAPRVVPRADVVVLGRRKINSERKGGCAPENFTR